ncbi:hypothetical protein [Moorena producens]|uniref:hypothetical protein n=2 Tax=Moorena TaxID=1155738 RepID=UPI003C7248A4
MNKNFILMKNQIVRQFSATIAATVIVFTSVVRTAFGQQTRASSRSMYEAGLNLEALFTAKD